MTLTVPPFPHSDEVPSVQKLASLLVCAVPEPDRKAATELLTSHILPVKLSGIDSHPNPWRLSVVVYNKLARTLTARPANMRLHALRLVGLDTEFTRLGRDALNLAITRFVVAHAGNLDAERLERWLTPAVMDLRSLPAEELAGQAGELLGSVGAWKERVRKEFPAEWDKYRVKHLQTRATLESARTGTFAEASGALLDFLRDAGQEPKELAFD